MLRLKNLALGYNFPRAMTREDFHQQTEGLRERSEHYLRSLITRGFDPEAIIICRAQTPTEPRLRLCELSKCKIAHRSMNKSF